MKKRFLGCGLALLMAGCDPSPTHEDSLDHGAMANILPGAVDKRFKVKDGTLESGDTTITVAAGAKPLIVIVAANGAICINGAIGAGHSITTKQGTIVAQNGVILIVHDAPAQPGSKLPGATVNMTSSPQ